MIRRRKYFQGPHKLIQANVSGCSIVAYSIINECNYSVKVFYADLSEWLRYTDQF